MSVLLRLYRFEVVHTFTVSETRFMITSWATRTGTGHTAVEDVVYRDVV
ncbi:MAG: hypothetical protein AVDCRST_MAG14-1196 [uncultured Rubrobacteraceae bacterium]|uniref:Uncharacterized protein n=1 Tax=uncultured Rubrobacteraceae bacterium TaxID=349277 RepID=A0A6J4QX09_9ACTN|nr:MAG: hypothetical protein AVDCRST_MAG14-1196 [uncultured Rubrobacteraceae bacterium]